MPPTRSTTAKEPETTPEGNTPVDGAPTFTEDLPPVRDDIPDGYEDHGPDGIVPNEVPWKGMFS